MHIREYLATLELVNKERRRAGLPELDHLPAGMPGHSRRCVIAEAIPGASVGSHAMRTTRSSFRALPRDVIRFVAAFDQEGGREQVDPGTLVDGGIEDDKGCLVSV